MSHTRMYVNGFSALHKSGIFTAEGLRAWGGDQNGPADVKRDQVLSSPFPSFGKLNIPDKLAFSSGASALSKVSEPGGDKTGICMCIPQGSLSTDLFFMDSVNKGFPSPAYFSATLPSSTIADLAIYFKLKGPDRIICGGDAPALSALDTAAYWLTKRKADKILWISVWEKSPINESSESDCAASMFLSLEPGQDTISEIILDLEPSGPAPDQAILNEQDLFMEVIGALMNKEQKIIYISESGFRGYISLQHK